MILPAQPLRDGPCYETTWLGWGGCVPALLILWFFCNLGKVPFFLGASVPVGRDNSVSPCPPFLLLHPDLRINTIQPIVCSLLSREGLGGCSGWRGKGDGKL